MPRAIRDFARVDDQGRLAVEYDGLPPGAPAEVIVLLDSGEPTGVDLTEYFGSVQGCFRSGEEADRFLSAGRDEWSA